MGVVANSYQECTFRWEYILSTERRGFWFGYQWNLWNRWGVGFSVLVLESERPELETEHDWKDKGSDGPTFGL